jgi:hypothetical protein
MDSPIWHGGVDWASRSHAVCIVDEHGEALERFTVEHTETGLRMLVLGAWRGRASPGSPSSGRTARSPTRRLPLGSRWWSSPAATSRRSAPATARPAASTAGSKHDRGDAFILADALRRRLAARLLGEFDDVRERLPTPPDAARRRQRASRSPRPRDPSAGGSLRPLNRPGQPELRWSRRLARSRPLVSRPLGPGPATGPTCRGA